MDAPASDAPPAGAVEVEVESATVAPAQADAVLSDSAQGKPALAGPALADIFTAPAASAPVIADAAAASPAPAVPALGDPLAGAPSIGDALEKSIGPLIAGASRDVLAVPRLEATALAARLDEDDEHSGTGGRVSRELAKLGDATDGDDEPTTIFSNLFPDLVPKRSSSSAPGADSASKIPPPPQASKTGSLPATLAAQVEDAEELDGPSPTQEAQILDFAVQKLGRSETSSLVGSSPPPHPRPPLKTLPPAPPRPSSAPSSPPRSTSVPPPLPSRKSSGPPAPPSKVEPGGDSLLALAAGSNPLRKTSAPLSAPPPPAPPLSSAPKPPFAVPLPRALEPATDPRARTVMAANASDAPWARPTRSAQGRSLLKSAIIIFALSAAATMLVLWLFTGGDGSASITAVDTENRPLQAAEVSVDGKVVCSQLPCELASLPAGKHRVSVRAGDQQSPEQVITVRSGKDAKVQFALTRASAGSGDAGLHVRAAATGLHLFINGEGKGELPLTLGGLGPGEVSLKIAGNPLYAPFAQNLVLKAGETITFEPKLVPVKALITIRPGDNSQGAFVEVIGPDRRQALFELPAKVEVAPSAKYRVRATRSGYRDFDTEVAFENSEAEKEVRIDLDGVGSPARVPVVRSPAASPAAAAAPPPPRSAPPSALAAAITPPGATPISPATPAPAAVAGTGTLNINSIPISNVLVDGRPIGPTPRSVPVPAGKHQVTFVHPTKGRKSISVNVVAGKAALATTKF